MDLKDASLLELFVKAEHSLGFALEELQSAEAKFPFGGGASPAERARFRGMMRQLQESREAAERSLERLRTVHSRYASDAMFD